MSRTTYSTVVLQEGQQPQPASCERVPLDGRQRRLSPQGGPHACHGSLADLLGYEVAGGFQMDRDGLQVEGRLPVEDHVERL